MSAIGASNKVTRLGTYLLSVGVVWGLIYAALCQSRDCVPPNRVPYGRPPRTFLSYLETSTPGGSPIPKGRLHGSVHLQNFGFPPIRHCFTDWPGILPQKPLVFFFLIYFI
jgi:hypothetical protein